jgi:RNA recognition motif-containing protein
LRQAAGQSRTNAGGKSAISIKGASGSTIEVKELAAGTTPADVEMIFQSCGKILASKLGPDPEDPETVTVHVKFSKRDDALRAVKTFDKQQADGRVLSVTILEETGIIERFSGQRVAPEIDLLQTDDSGSGMRSDALLNAPGAQVLTAPPKVGGGRR